MGEKTNKKTKKTLSSQTSIYLKMPPMCLTVPYMKSTTFLMLLDLKKKKKTAAKRGPAHWLPAPSLLAKSRRSNYQAFILIPNYFRGFIKSEPLAAASSKLGF